MKNTEVFNQAKSLISKVDTVLEIGSEFRASYNERYALDFDPLQLFKIDENKLSQLLVFLLNPKESHGQNDRFLKVFIDQIFPQYQLDVGAFEYIEYKESTEDNRRLDIVISFNNIVIGIENKIWAVDQPNQLRDYHQALLNKGKKHTLLIYLTPYGKEPSEQSISNEESAELQKTGLDFNSRELLLDQIKLKFKNYKLAISGFFNDSTNQFEIINDQH